MPIDDVLGAAATSRSESNSANPTTEDLLKAIRGLTDSVDELSAYMRQNGGRVGSQANTKDAVRDAVSGYGYKGKFQRGYEDHVNNRSSKGSFKGGLKGASSSFTDAFEKELLDSFIGSDFKDRLKGVFNDFAKNLGVDIKDIPQEVGKRLGKQASEALKNTSLGKSLQSKIANVQDKAINVAKELGNKVFGGSPTGSASATTQAANAASASQSVASTTAAAGDATTANAALAQGSASAAGTAGTGGAVAGGSGALGASLAELASSVASMLPEILAILAVLVIVEKVLKEFVSIGEGFKKFFKALGAAAKREQETRQKNLEAANKRFEDSVQDLIRYPFDLLKEAAQDLYNTWEKNIQVINATQGYTKADLQDLMSLYAQRLRSEGLERYISVSDLTDNLSKVLESGLSGHIAEEFAYQATKLGAAVPTQDFFSYASTYASIAANAVRLGQDQESAISLANESLYDFTNSLLYANRELTGGFTTGLKDAEDIYSKAVKSAQAARSSNIEGIASVLLGVQGYVGAVAPDVASSLTDAIYKMLTGGNASDIVALRSLAGINASNTEFLQAVAKNPQKIFSTLFTNLAKMYTQSDAAYMEKAEGYASLFGLSSDAFARVDFAGLADAIQSMSTQGDQLNQNMQLLLDGQTATTTEQLKAQQINQLMIDEGLAYVIDNQAAQFIQQHMWDEQLAREITTSTFAVELAGDSSSALLQIVQAVQNLLNLLNPVSWFRRGANIVATAYQAEGYEKDINEILEKSYIGRGSAALPNYLNIQKRNQTYQVVTRLNELLGGTSRGANLGSSINTWNTILDPIAMAGNFGEWTSAVGGLLGVGSGRDLNGKSNILTKTGQMYRLGSQYSWGGVSKSSAQLAGALLAATAGTTIGTAISSGTLSATDERTKRILEEAIEDISTRDEDETFKSYDEWASYARGKGLSNIDKAIEDAGYTSEYIESLLQEEASRRGAAKQEERAKAEEDLVKLQSEFYNKDNIQTNLWDPLSSINVTLKSFYDEFVKYFIEHQYYNETFGYKYSDVERIQKELQAQDNGDTVYALAEMLTKNLVDLQDPTMQTNALLAQILIVVNAIMNQGNGIPAVGGASLPDTLQGLAAGAGLGGAVLGLPGAIVGGAAGALLSR